METRERFAPTDMLLKNRTIQPSFVSPFFPLSLHDFGLPSIEFSACAHKHTNTHVHRFRQIQIDGLTR